MLKVGDKVKLNGCPFDEQIPEDLMLYMKIKDKIQTVHKIMKVNEEGTSDQWVKTDYIPSWTDKAWFERVK